jgi:hypothetical protein
LGRVSLAYPDYARFNEAVGFGTKKEAHRLAQGKSDGGLQLQAIRGEVNSSSEVFSLVTLYYKSHSHFDPPTLRPALNWSCVLTHAMRIQVGGWIINGPSWGSMT